MPFASMEQGRSPVRMRPPLGAAGSGTTPVLASAEPSPAGGRIAVAPRRAFSVSGALPATSRATLAHQTRLRAALRSRSRHRPHAAQRNTRSSSRSSARTTPQPEQRLLLGKKRGATTKWLPYQRHLYSIILRNSPKLWSASERLRPALAATLRPGSSTVPRAERDMPRTLRSSTTTVP
jgi:hypothetical protein